MTVYVAQHRINDMKSYANKLISIVESLSGDIPESDRAVLNEYDIDVNVLSGAAQYLNITASEFQDDLNNCEVDCKCW